MDKLLETVATQAPSIVVLFLLVQTFLKRDKERDSFIAQLHSEHLAARGESRDAIKENTNSNRAVVQAMTTLNDTVTRFMSPEIKPR